MLATVMRAALPTRHDKQIVLVLSRALRRTKDWDAFEHMVKASAHNVVLDKDSEVDPGGDVAWQALRPTCLRR